MATIEPDLIMDLELIAIHLRQRRKKLGLTQTDVAKRMGISQARVSQIETGDVEVMKIVTLVSYADALGVRIKLIVES